MKLKSPSQLIITVLTSFLILALIIYFTILYFNFFPRGEDVHVYLPKNYDKNYIIIFYDQEDGKSKERINDDRLYRIPKSGILFTQYSMQREWVKYKYFYVNKKGTILEEIKFNDYTQKLNPNKVYVMNNYNTFKEVEGYESENIVLGKPETKGDKKYISAFFKTKKIIDSIVKIKYPSLKSFTDLKEEK